MKIEKIQLDWWSRKQAKLEDADLSIEQIAEKVNEIIEYINDQERLKQIREEQKQLTSARKKHDKG